MITEEMVDQLAIEETKKILMDIATHFSRNTKILVVPEGTKLWRTEWLKGVSSDLFDKVNSQAPKTIYISLIQFLGMYIGYNNEIDILVCWKLKGENHA